MILKIMKSPVRVVNILIFSLVINCIVDSCLYVPDVQLSNDNAVLKCAELEGRQLSVDIITKDAELKNQAVDYVNKSKANLWVTHGSDGNDRLCIAFFWSNTVNITKDFDCNEKFYPACVLDSKAYLCKKIEMGSNNMNTDNKNHSVLIGSICGGAVCVLFISFFICIIVRKVRSTSTETREVTSFNLKRYRVSEGFNVPVITDSQFQQSQGIAQNQTPGEVNPDCSDENITLQRTNDWLEQQTTCIEEGSGGIDHYQSHNDGGDHNVVGNV